MLQSRFVPPLQARRAGGAGPGRAGLGRLRLAPAGEGSRGFTGRREGARQPSACSGGTLPLLASRCGAFAPVK